VWGSATVTAALCSTISRNAEGHTKGSDEGISMGLFRKIASVSTLGAVDLRSDKERTARKTAKGARAAKRSAREAQAQTRLLAAQNRLLASQQAAPTVVRQPVPAEPANVGSITERLVMLDQLAESGAITPQERAQRRGEILRGV
jgi:hypothetical protein